MTKYDVIDEAIIDASPGSVYNAVIEVYEGKNNWWMPHLSSRLCKGSSCRDIGSLYNVTVHGIPPITFTTKTVETRTNEMIGVNYIDGAFIGEGLWTFEDLDGKTKMVFRWRTSPNSVLLRMVAPFYPIAKSHSVVMRSGFKKLKRYLEHK
jgi:ribosome-associated toxin RatA of RatAB toxin-antitoxin module